MTSRIALAAAAGLMITSSIFAEPSSEPTSSPATAPTSTPTTAPSSAPSKYTKVTKAALHLAVHATGTFEPVDPFEVRVKPKAYAGDLTIISAVAPSAKVHAGDTIIEIDSTAIRRQIISAENETTTAEAMLAKTQSDATLGDASDALSLKMQQDEVTNSINGLSWWEKVDGAQMLENADLSVKYSKDAVDDQQQELDQLKKMYKSEELTSATADIVVKRALQQLERLKTGLQMTTDRAARTKQNDYDAAHAKWKYNVDQQKQALDRLVATQAQSKVLRDGALVSAKLAVETANEKLTNIRGDLAQFIVKAPSDMTIFYGSITGGSWQGANPRAYRAGDKVAPTSIFMTGVKSGDLQVIADVPEAKVLLVAAGMKATIVPTAMPQFSIDGTCEVPALAAGADKSFNVPIDVKGVDEKIEPGMKASLTIGSDDVKEKLLRLPLAAVSRGKAWLHAADSDKDKEVDVEVGKSDGESVEIKSGLNEGDEVLSNASAK